MPIYQQRVVTRAVVSCTGAVMSKIGRKNLPKSLWVDGLVVGEDCLLSCNRGGSVFEWELPDPKALGKEDKPHALPDPKAVGEDAEAYALPDPKALAKGGELQVPKLLRRWSTTKQWQASCMQVCLNKPLDHTLTHTHIHTHTNFASLEALHTRPPSTAPGIMLNCLAMHPA